MHGSDAVCQLAQERVGSIVFGVGFRLGSKTQKVVHRMKYGGFPSCGRDLGRWMAQGWVEEAEALIVMMDAYLRQEELELLRPSDVGVDPQTGEVALLLGNPLR